jgi:cytochrome c oxidase subunit IV
LLLLLGWTLLLSLLLLLAGPLVQSGLHWDQEPLQLCWCVQVPLLLLLLLLAESLLLGACDGPRQTAGDRT